MITLVPTSDHPFYLWQALVQIHAMRGSPARWLFYCPRRPSKILSAMMAAGIADIDVWPDWKRDHRYNASMKPWLVGKYLTEHPEDGSVLIIDPDVIPTGRPLPALGSARFLGTDTDDYSGPAWLDTKGALEPLCDLVGVDADQVRAYRGIGAQYLTAGIPGPWWEEVAQLSILAHRLLSAHPVDAQPWCAEMYVTHLAAVRDGYAPTPHEDMAMVWADGPATGWTTHGFFHDAGVTSPRPGIFCKSTWQRSPFGRPVDVRADTAGYRYLELIRATEAEWPHLVRLFQ